MRIAVSNIAWPSGAVADAEASAILVEQGAEGVEIAPTKVWPHPLNVDKAEIRAYRRAWEVRGLRIVALQALLFGRQDLILFGDEAVRRRTLDYLKGMIDLAAALGAGALVFGSPKNRRVDDRPRDQVDTIALAVFRELGDCAAGQGVSFCIEANPVEYGCDFVTTTAEAAKLVERVDSAGFGLHLDTGGMTLTGDDPVREPTEVDRVCRHFHISEPYLSPVGPGGANHRGYRTMLQSMGYDGWISIEMKESTSGTTWVDALRNSIGYAKEAYLFPD